MMLAGDLDLGIATTTRKRILRKPSCPDERSPHSEISVAQNKHPTTSQLRLRNRGNPAEIHRQPELRKNLNLIRAINLLNAHAAATPVSLRHLAREKHNKGNMQV